MYIYTQPSNTALDVIFAAIMPVDSMIAEEMDTATIHNALFEVIQKWSHENPHKKKYVHRIHTPHGKCLLERARRSQE
jgi:hypothetical protein